MSKSLNDRIRDDDLGEIYLKAGWYRVYDLNTLVIQHAIKVKKLADSFEDAKRMNNEKIPQNNK